MPRKLPKMSMSHKKEAAVAPMGSRGRPRRSCRSLPRSRGRPRRGLWRGDRCPEERGGGEVAWCRPPAIAHHPPSTSCCYRPLPPQLRRLHLRRCHRWRRKPPRNHLDGDCCGRGPRHWVCVSSLCSGHRSRPPHDPGGSGDTRRCVAKSNGEVSLQTTKLGPVLQYHS